MKSGLSKILLVSSIGLISSCGYDRVYNPLVSPDKKVKIKESFEANQSSVFQYLNNKNLKKWKHFSDFANDTCGDMSCLDFSLYNSKTMDEFHLLLSIISQETRFGKETKIKDYPVSISKSKALNYTQLMPCTSLDYDLNPDPHSFWFDDDLCYNNMNYTPNPKIDDRVDNEKAIMATLKHLRFLDKNLNKLPSKKKTKLKLISYYRGLSYTLSKYEKCSLTTSCFTKDDLNYYNYINYNFNILKETPNK